ncbi:MAG: HAD-IA family hydrolase [Thiotrichaceae bacterium]
MAKPFKLLVFDWDGTVMDSVARIVSSFQSAISDLDLPPRTDQEIRIIIGLGLEQAIQRLYPEINNSQMLLLIQHYREHFFSPTALATPLFPDADTVLRDLVDAGYQLAVATGKSRHGLNEALQQTGLKDLFMATRCAEETFSKPHPLMLQEILDELAIPASQALMIGDTDFDLQMATNAGVASVAVSYGVHEKSQLLACNPLTCLDSLQELPLWLSN